MKPLLLLLPLCCLSFVLKAQNSSDPTVPGFLIFDMGANSLNSKDTHIAHVIACDTILEVDGLIWNKAGQIRDHIPFGPQGNTGQKFIAKYYIASPPLFTESPKNPEAKYNIGLVTPDEFWFTGEKPAQQIYMNYSVLELMQIEYFSFSYDSTFQKEKKILVPFKVECADYPWNANSGIPAARGASGIGYFLGTSGDSNNLFLPYHTEPIELIGEKTRYVKEYLNCQVTLLNDVLSDHTLKFVVNGVNMGESIDLRKYAGTNPQIHLTRTPRFELPCGCKPPSP